MAQNLKKTLREHVIWCTVDTECSNGRKCQSTGQMHFGTPVGFCCLTKADRCSLPLNPGYGDCFKPSVQRFYFDSVELRCKPFMFVDCVGGNENRFDSAHECQRFCENTACNDGEVVQIVKGDVKVCDMNQNECPNGYHCAYDGLYRRHVCCGHPRRETCPAGYLAYLEPGTLSVKPCQPSAVADGCPADFFCITQSTVGYCCTPERDICPLGQKRYLHPVSGSTLKCDPLLYPSTCPSKHHCIATITGARWGACCDETVTATCPESTKPYIDAVSSRPVICTVGVTLCADGFVCQSAYPGDLIGFCCTFSPKTTQLILSELRTHQMSKNLSIAEEPPKNSTESEISNPLAVSHHESISDFYSNNHENRVQNSHIETPIRRIIDIQKEVDAAAESIGFYNTMPPVFSSTTPKSTFKYLECPGDSSPVFYPGTQLLMECSAAKNKEFDCPEKAECVLALNDLFGRSVCCQPSEASTEEIFLVTPKPLRILYPESDETDFGSRIDTERFIYTVTLRAPEVPIERTVDPFCPRIVKDRKCSPGAHDACPEYKFYCQYNIQHRDFRCCSLEQSY
ncbi:unnamed protein product, partial [Mesorhabditis spiculigera]